MVKKLSFECFVFKLVLKLIVFFLVLVCLIIGLVNLKIGIKMEIVKCEGIDIVFVVDVLKSMFVEDVVLSCLEKSK